MANILKNKTNYKSIILAMAIKISSRNLAGIIYTSNITTILELFQCGKL